MAKESGIGYSTTIDDSGGTGRDISNDFTDTSTDTPRSLIEATGLDVSSAERLAGIADGTFSGNGKFDDAANMAHAVFKDIATNTAERTVVQAHSGQTLTMEMLFSSYALARAQGGDLTFSVAASLSATTSFGWS